VVENVLAPGRGSDETCVSYSFLAFVDSHPVNGCKRLCSRVQASTALGFEHVLNVLHGRLRHAICASAVHFPAAPQAVPFHIKRRHAFLHAPSMHLFPLRRALAGLHLLLQRSHAIPSRAVRARELTLPDSIETDSSILRSRGLRMRSVNGFRLVARRPPAAAGSSCSSAATEALAYDGKGSGACGSLGGVRCATAAALPIGVGIVIFRTRRRRRRFRHGARSLGAIPLLPLDSASRAGQPLSPASSVRPTPPRENAWRKLARAHHRPCNAIRRPARRTAPAARSANRLP